ILESLILKTVIFTLMRKNKEKSENHLLYHTVDKNMESFFEINYVMIGLETIILIFFIAFLFQFQLMDLNNFLKINLDFIPENLGA
ncbi:hypothetical protein L9F63_025577, partial [Diploptera punctata]